MTAEQSWVEGRVDVLLAALHELGMSASRTAATDLIYERVDWVSSQVGISPAAARRHLTDEALADLARAMVFSVVDETPGADVLDAPRTSAIPLPMLGRCISALAEAVQVRLRERDDLDHLRTTITQLAQQLAALGLVVAEPGPEPDAAQPVVMMPPGLVNRAARYLEASAALVEDGVLPEHLDTSHAVQLAATFRNDAAVLRRRAGE
jgi:hypothetical protein